MGKAEQKHQHSADEIDVFGFRAVISTKQFDIRTPGNARIIWTFGIGEELQERAFKLAFFICKIIKHNKAVIKQPDGIHEAVNQFFLIFLQWLIRFPLKLQKQIADFTLANLRLLYAAFLNVISNLFLSGLQRSETEKNGP